MSDTRSHDAQVIVETAQAAVEPHDLAEHVVGLVVPAGATFHVEDLKPKLDLRGVVPPRTKGSVALTEHLDRAYRQKFPGVEATDQGIVMDPARAVQTMRHWKP